MEASEVFDGSNSGFMSLLRQLAEQHHREVGALSEEVARLQRVCDEIASNTSSDRRRSNMEGEYKRPLLSDPLGLLAKDEIPDEGALTAAFMIAKEVDQCKPQDTGEGPDDDALDAALDAASLAEERSDAEELLFPTELYDDATPDEPNPLALPPTPAERERLLQGTPLSRNGSRMQAHATIVANEMRTSLVESIRGTRTESDDCLNRNTTASSINATKSIWNPQTLDRWGTLIKAVKREQAVAQLPVINEVWKQAQENRPAGAARFGMLQLDLLVSSAAKASKFQSGDESQPISKMGSANSERSGWFGTSQDSWCLRMWRNAILHPTCRRRICWDVSGILLLIHDLIFIPMTAFDAGTDGLPKEYEQFMDALDIFGATFWTIDITVSFRTGYYSQEGFVELRPMRVARNYMKTWLPLDLIIVCADWGSMFLGMSSASGFMRLGKTVSRFMRVFRLLRFLKMNRALKEVIDRINSEYVLQVIGLMKTLVMIVVINHYIACAWYGLGSIGLISRWPDKFLVNYPVSFSYAYTTSLHWSLTQFTPASMEVVPQNSIERTFVIAVIIVALVAFSSFVSSITAAMTHIRQINAQKMQLESKIRQFFSEHKISHAMASRVWHFLRKNRIGTSKRLKETDIAAFKMLPARIKEDLRLEIYSPILTVHPLFADYSKREEMAMLKIVNEAVDEQSLVVGEELFRNVEVVSHMIFIVFGGLCYHEHDTTDDLPEEDNAEVHAGQWACEPCLWADRVTLPGFFMTLPGGSEIILLNASKFQAIANSSPFSGSSIFLAKYAALFMDGFKQTSTDIQTDVYSSYEPQDILFNRLERVQDFATQADEESGSVGNRSRNTGDFLGLMRGSFVNRKTTVTSGAQSSRLTKMRSMGSMDTASSTLASGNDDHNNRRDSQGSRATSTVSVAV